VELTLHRGIAVDRAAVTQVAARIRERGMQGDEGKWAFRWLDLRPHLSEILQQPSLYAEITRQTEEPSFSAICACGDAKSATYYACKHNLNEGEEGLIITFRSPILDCYVDCRDFLCTVFQLWDQATAHREYDDVAQLLTRSFGSAVLRYFKQAQRLRIRRLA
jgi:hypothetical protein